jgi:hypothetical protein
MKTLQIIVAILLFTTFSACTSDTDNSIQIPTTVTWSLTHVSGGIAGFDETFEIGLITWTFNSQTNIMAVVNNNTDDSSYDIFESGLYSYSIQNDGTNYRMTIDGGDFGVITETENEITLDQQVDDGFIITLKR